MCASCYINVTQGQEKAFSSPLVGRTNQIIRTGRIEQMKKKIEVIVQL